MSGGLILTCVVFECDWFWKVGEGGMQRARDEERKHWEAYHEPKKEDEDGDS